ncbi:MAG: hypothetical protein ACYTEP_08545 [Planctomycetota bacterium]|jgi:hypothetical protein
MTTLLLTFAFFALAITAMAVGVLVKGQALAKSCGGSADQVEADLLGDCVCARKDADICTSDEGNELVMLAEIGNPKRKDYFRKTREDGASFEV